MNSAKAQLFSFLKVRSIVSEGKSKIKKQHMQNFKLRVWLIISLLVICVGCDQITKQVAVKHLKGEAPRYFFNDTVQLLYAENSGAWGGLGSQLPDWLRVLLLSVLPAVILVVIAVQVFRARESGVLKILGLTFFVAGGIGNLIDRFAYGYVIDFMYVGYNNIGTNIFNFADVQLMTGMVCLIVSGLQESRTKSAKQTSA